MLGMMPLEAVRSVAVGVLAPLLVAASIATLGWRPWRRDIVAGSGAWVAALAVGAALVVGHGIVVGWPALPPIDAVQWVFWLGIVATLLGAGAGRWTLPLSFQWPARAVSMLTIALLVLRPLLVAGEWNLGEAIANVAAAAATGLVFWSGLAVVGRRASSVGAALVMLVVSSGAAVLLALSGSASLGQIAGAVAAALGVIGVVGWWRPKLAIAAGAAPVTAIAIWTLLVGGHYYADLGWTPMVLVALSPLATLASGLATAMVIATAGAIALASASAAGY